jgi:hypothetical protein
MRRAACSVGAVKFFGSRRASSRSAEELGEAELRARVESVLASAVGRAPDLEPLTRDRIVAWLEDSGFTYFIDSDGDVGGVWHGWMFYFLALGEHGEVLQVRGQWHRALTIERLEEVLEVCNADVTVDVEHGATDDQLDQLLQCGLTTGSMFFEHLDEVFPDPLLGAP